MKFLSDKTKQFLLLLVKIVVVSLAFYFIYRQLSNNPHLDWPTVQEILSDTQNSYYLVLVLILTFFNRFIEILKWQNLASLIEPLDLSQATKQVLSALTLGIFTPNGIGEYAGKALYYDRKHSSQVIFLNAVCNGVQVLYALLFGFLGLWMLNVNFQLLSNHTLWLALCGVLAVSIVLYYYRHKQFKGYSLTRLFQALAKIPREKHRKNLILALLRYLTFTHQYILLYRMFGVDLPYWELLTAIAAIYLLASSLPSFQFLEFAIKGSIALYLFDILGVNPWVVALVATFIWLLNIVLPVCIGSIYVLRFKLKK